VTAENAGAILFPANVFHFPPAVFLSLSLLGNLRWLGKRRRKHKFYLFSCTCISMKGPLILPPSDISPFLADITRTLFCFAVFTRHWAGRATFPLTRRGFSSDTTPRGERKRSRGLVWNSNQEFSM